jgi:toxin ParE1/3/4
LILHFSEQAEQDLREIWLYVAGDSPRAADRLLRRLLAISEALTEFPQLGLARDDLMDGLRGLRADNYILFYRAREQGLHIERVLHTRLDITGFYF